MRLSKAGCRGAAGDFPVSDDEEYFIEPEVQEILEYLTNEAVTRIEEGENPEAIVYGAIESAFNLGVHREQECREY